MNQKGSLHRLIGLFVAFFRLGLFTFGGGFAMIPIIERELVDRKGWLSEEELVDSVSLIQGLPGPVAVNMAIIVGYQSAGRWGALVSAAGVVIPSFLVIVAIAGSYAWFKDSPLANGFFDGVKPVVVGLIIAAAFKLGKNILRSGFSWLITGMVFILIVFLRVSPVPALILAGLIGIFIGKRAETLSQQEEHFTD